MPDAVGVGTTGCEDVELDDVVVVVVLVVLVVVVVVRVVLWPCIKVSRVTIALHFY